MSILCKKQTLDARGRFQHISPDNAGWDSWRYVGFEAYQLEPGKSLSLPAGDTEVCMVLLAGRAHIKTDAAEFKDIGERLNPFAKVAPYSVYYPMGDTATVVALTDLEIGVCRAAIGEEGNKQLPARLISPKDCVVEHRGKGQNKRLVHHILPETVPANSLLIVEVYTDEGCSSSYPSHKHDESRGDEETYLEETYYHRIKPSQGFAFQRVYTGDGSIDEAVAVHDGDVVKVPKGYHPVATLAGYDNYYLNVMAGPVRQWRFSWQPEHVWVNSDDYH